MTTRRGLPAKFDSEGVTLGDVVLLHDSDETTIVQIRVIRPEGRGISVGRFGVDAEGVALAERFDPRTGRSLLPESKRFLSTPDPFAGMPEAPVRDADRVDRPVILPEHPCIFGDEGGGIAAAFEAIPESLRRKALAARDAEAERLEALFDHVSDMTWEEWLVEYGVTVTPPDGNWGEQVHIRSGFIGGKPRRFRLETAQSERYVSGEEVARMVAEADAHAAKKGTP